MDLEGERQRRICEILEGIEGVDWKFIQHPVEDEILMLMEPKQLPIERAAEKLLEAGWQKIDAGKDDSLDRFDWFTFRIPDSEK